jgi:hypothetical protein
MGVVSVDPLLPPRELAKPPRVQGHVEGSPWEPGISCLRLGLLCPCCGREVVGLEVEEDQSQDLGRQTTPRPGSAAALVSTTTTTTTTTTPIRPARPGQGNGGAHVCLSRSGLDATAREEALQQPDRYTQAGGESRQRRGVPP